MTARLHSKYFAHERRVEMKKKVALLFCCFLSFTILACENELQGADEIEQLEEIGEMYFIQEDFALRIDTLPYRGAVLFIDYYGETDISDYELTVDIALNDTVMQEKMPVEYVDGDMIAVIIDLMYLPGDELDFVLKVKEEGNEIFQHHHSEPLQRYPWKDWMLAEGEWFTIVPSFEHPNFIYDYPESGNNSGSHSSWDIWTTSGSAVNVYSGTIGMVHSLSPEGNLEIYNPYVGAIVQYGHTQIIDGNFDNNIINPGDHIANVIIADEHIHYSVYRPYRYTNSSLRLTYSPPDEWAKYYWPIQYDHHGLYDDPFYWHEPTTLGYWYEDTLPPGLKEEMISMFQKDNPGLILPVMKPSGGKLTDLAVDPGNLSPYFTEGGSAYTIGVGHDSDTLNVTARLSDTDAIMTINGEPTLSDATRRISLNDAGESTAITIVVTAANGTVSRTYDLTVKRSSAP